MDFHSLLREELEQAKIADEGQERFRRLLRWHLYGEMPEGLQQDSPYPVVCPVCEEETSVGRHSELRTYAAWCSNPKCPAEVLWVEQMEDVEPAEPVLAELLRAQPELQTVLESHRQRYFAGHRSSALGALSHVFERIGATPEDVKELVFQVITKEAVSGWGV
jgi:hypothetical protein